MKRKINTYLLINFVCLTLLIFSIILSLIPFISFTSNNFVPAFFGSSVIKVRTENMMPEFKINEIIIVKKNGNNEIKIGDRIAYYVFDENGKAVKTAFHEVSEILKNSKDENLYQVKGLANSEPENDLVHQGAVIGEHDKNAVFLKSVFTFSTSAPGIIILIVLPIVLISALQIIFFINVNMTNKSKETIGQKENTNEK